MCTVPLFAALLAAPGLGAEQRFPPGAVVETVHRGNAADVAGIKPGDLILTWSRADGGGSWQRELRSPLDLGEIESEQLPRTAIALHGTRDGRPFTAVAPREGWGLNVEARPDFPPVILTAYEEGRRSANAGRPAAAEAAWRSAADAAGHMPDGVAARCWLLARVASAWAAQDAGRSHAAYREVRACAGGLEPQWRAVLLEDEAKTEDAYAWFAESAVAYESALRLRQHAPPAPVARARVVRELALVAEHAGDTPRARELHGRAVEILEREAPASVSLSIALVDLARLTADAGDRDAAMSLCRRAVAIAEGGGFEGLTLTTALSCVAGRLLDLGDLAGGERLFRRILDITRRLAPDSPQEVRARINVGVAAYERGDLEAAEELERSALAIVERAQGSPVDWSPRFRPVLLFNLASNAIGRGRLQEAHDLLRAAVPEFERAGRSFLAQALTALGETTAKLGDQGRARESLERALELAQQQASGSGQVADTLTTLGDLEAAEGHWDAAESAYERARAILERVAPIGARLALVLHGLGKTKAKQGRPEEAALLMSRAIEVLEAQRGRIGGSEEARSVYSARFAAMYHDRLAALIALGRTEEAFAVLERSRARALIALMAQRDLVLDDAAPALAAELRRADAEYQRASAELAGLDTQKDAAEIDRAAVRLRDAAHKQAEALETIRGASPQLAEVRDPHPLDAGGVRGVLDRGSVLLAYSVGEEGTILFVVAPAADTVRAVRIAAGDAALRERVAAWRRMAEKRIPPPRFAAESGALYDLLLGPAESEIRAAERIVICPDGALHQLPFAALRRDRAFLAEWKPLIVVPSGTVLGQLTRSRAAVPGRGGLVAFGGVGAAARTSLPGSRREVEAIRRAFPQSMTYLGAAATPARVKEAVKDARYVHFACHALVDERFPLQSALALTPDPGGAEQGDGGRLYAWQIFERVRVDADLVTLSACRSAGGTEIAGEGLIGLTRAFQYAGARSVLASLWNVGDISTASFMEAFYRQLAHGASKADALRRTQVAAIRAGQHPVRWAAFQIYGDWR